MAQRILDKQSLETVIMDFNALTTEIREFFSSDPNLVLAIQENSQIPFWDIDENYGGS